MAMISSDVSLSATTKPPETKATRSPGETGEAAQKTKQSIEELKKRFSEIQNKIDELKVQYSSLKSSP